MKIFSDVEKKQKNFWNGCLFHPTDAVEDPWGKRILDQISKDKAIKMVRIYTMFEDIVYLNENNELQYDFRLSDLRLDYLVDKGFDLLLAYGGMPDCIANNQFGQSSMSKNKLRYKGKMWNTSPPKDIKLWEDICYEYTRHIVERYGVERVSKWRVQCFNEPDHKGFFMRELPNDEESAKIRCDAYCEMYKVFVNAVRRVSDKIVIGGPAAAGMRGFLGYFLDYVKEHKLDLDFVSTHNYGVSMPDLRDGYFKICVQNSLLKDHKCLDIMKEHGFEDCPLFVDEWGMVSRGFANYEDCPQLICRETEVFSSYFVKLIHEMVFSDYEVEGMMICLSGQHEMTEDFSGFRNFFTLNFIKKPIYNAYILSSKLSENILRAEKNNENIFLLPTKDDAGNYAVLLTYSSEYFEEDIPAIEETLTFEEDIKDKQVTVWCIDKETTNPYRLYKKLGIDTPNDEQIKMLREEGELKPILTQKGSEKLHLRLTPNATFLITVNS